MVREAPLLAGLGLFSPDGRLDTFGSEVAALTKTLLAAPYRYEHDALVLAALAPNGDVSATGRTRPTSAEEVLERVEAAVRVVEEKAPEHASAYKTLVLEVARSTAGVSRRRGQPTRLATTGGQPSFPQQLRAIVHREPRLPTHAPVAPPSSLPPRPEASAARRSQPARTPRLLAMLAKVRSVFGVARDQEPQDVPLHCQEVFPR